MPDKRKLRKIRPIKEYKGVGFTLRKEPDLLDPYPLLRHLRNNGFTIVSERLPLAAKDEGWNAIIEDGCGQQYLAVLSKFI